MLSAVGSSAALPLSSRTTRALELAHQHAMKLGQVKLGSEHLLLGLASEAEESGAAWLAGMGTNADDLLEITACLLGCWNAPESSDPTSLSDNVQMTLASAKAEALVLGHGQVEPEHVLLGLLQLEDCQAFEILDEMWLEQEVMRQEVIAALDERGHGYSA